MLFNASASCHLSTVHLSIITIVSLLAVPNTEGRMVASAELFAKNGQESPLLMKVRGRFRGRGLRQGAHYSGPMLTREQLRQCLVLEKDINVVSRNIEVESIPLKAATNKLDVLAKEVEKSDAAVDAYSQESVESHNKLVREYNAALAEYNATMPEALARVNTKVGNMNATVSRFNSQCADMAYYIHDMEAAEKELGIAHSESNK
ncbi:MAG: hypothetical protein U0319_03390 [Nitrospira sp.]